MGYKLTPADETVVNDTQIELPLWAKIANDEPLTDAEFDYVLDRVTELEAAAKRRRADAKAHIERARQLETSAARAFTEIATRLLQRQIELAGTKKSAVIGKHTVCRRANPDELVVSPEFRDHNYGTFEFKADRLAIRKAVESGIELEGVRLIPVPESVYLPKKDGEE